MNKIAKAIVLVSILIAVFLQLYNRNSVPICLNGDEVAFAYNSISLSSTLRDEHGHLLPLRLQSFDDFKLPLYSYLSIPLLKLFSPDLFSIRILNILLGIAFVPLIYLLAKEFFEKEKVSLASAILTSSTLWIYILSRHAHEAVLSAFFVLLACYFFLQYQKKSHLVFLLVTNLSLLLSTFSYHTGRIFFVFFAAYQLYFILRNLNKTELQKKILQGLIIVSILAVPFVVDYSYGASRVQNLLFFNRAGFQMRLDEYLGEHPVRVIHNKGTEAVRELTSRYFSQLSTDFLIRDGDKNPRFGFEAMAPISPALYLLTLIGLYFLYADRQKARHQLLLLLLISPLGNALTFQEASITRVYFMIFPIILISAYGLVRFLESISNFRVRYVVFVSILMIHGFFLFFAWDVYLNHYYNRAYVTRSWQCGYHELFEDIKSDLDKFDHVYITERYGQPYIFALYYLGINPADYQQKAIISPPDEYGFSQVKSYDKFIFDFMPEKLSEKKSLFIGFPDEFNGTGISEVDVRKIKFGREEIFWVYENK